MNTVDNHIARLGIQSTRSIRDGDVYANAEQDLSNGRASIDAVLASVETYKEGTEYITAGGRTITVLPKLVLVGGAMALVLCGEVAKDALQTLIINQPSWMMRTPMIKEVNRMDKEWVADCLRDLIDKVDETTAIYIRELMDATRKTAVQSPPPMTSSGLDIDTWIAQLLDMSQCKNALTHLSKNITLVKLNESQHQAKQVQVANNAFPLMTSLDDLSYQIKAAQLAYRYATNLDQWIEVLDWCEKHYTDTALDENMRFKILDSMAIKLDHHPYKTDARLLLEDSLLDFIEHNTIYRLEVAATKILIMNHLAQPPQKHLVRNKEMNEQATLKCAECGKKIKPSETIGISLLSEKFCSRDCSTAYIMRTKGSMNPRYW